MATPGPYEPAQKMVWLSPVKARKRGLMRLTTAAPQPIASLLPAPPEAAVIPFATLAVVPMMCWSDMCMM